MRSSTKAVPKSGSFAIRKKGNNKIKVDDIITRDPGILESKSMEDLILDIYPLIRNEHSLELSFFAMPKNNETKLIRYKWGVL